MKRIPALVYYTQLCIAGHEPSLEDFILKGYSRATYFRAKKEFKEYYGDSIAEYRKRVIQNGRH